MRVKWVWYKLAELRGKSEDGMKTSIGPSHHRHRDMQNWLQKLKMKDFFIPFFLRSLNS